MWIVIRLVLALVGFLIGRRNHRKVPPLGRRFQGVPYFHIERTHKKKIKGFEIGMARRSPSWVRFHRESWLDRVFKWIGIATEIETGDASFDDRVYVMGDHPGVADVLRDRPDLRAAIRRAFNLGYTRVLFDGTYVSMERPASSQPTHADLSALAQIHAASALLEGQRPSPFADRFFWKALVVEGVIWSLAGYAVGAGIELFVHREDVHLWQRELFWLSLNAAAGAFIVLFALIVVWLRGSSRGHRVILESAFLLILGLPLGMLQVASDTNRVLDTAEPERFVRLVSQCERRAHRGRRNRVRYSYHLSVEPGPGPRLPSSIEVTSRLCNAAGRGSDVEFAIGPGRWGVAWYREIAIGNVRWSSLL